MNLRKRKVGGFYVLDENGLPVEADLMEWTLMAEGSRILRQSFYENVQDWGPSESFPSGAPGNEGRRILVSTVFLGIDHNWSDQGPPILWETMVFGGPDDGAQQRYCSKDAALVGHQLWEEKVTSYLKRPPDRIEPLVVS